MNIRAVIFDLFGTLITNYDRKEYLSVIEQMGEAVGADPVEFRTLWRKHYVERLTGVFKTESDNIRWVCDQLGVAPSAPQVEDSNRTYLEYALPNLETPRDGAGNVLTELKDRGIQTGLLSDCGPWVPKHWGRFPVSELIDFPVYSCSAGIKKPDPEVYRTVLDGLAVEAQQAMYVADGNGQELVVAGQLGMRAVRITPWNAPGPTPDADYSTDWHGESIGTLGDVLTLLD